MIRRLPKRGFKNPNHIEFVVVNLNVLEKNFQDGDTIDRLALRKKGLIGKSLQPLKILANGELTKKFTIVADKFSAAAKAKIEEKGGSCQETAAEAPAEEKKD